MKLSYDKEADAAYIYLNLKKRGRGKLAKTIPVTDDVVLDFGSKGNLMGVELLNASSHIDRRDLEKATPRKVDIPMEVFVS